MAKNTINVTVADNTEYAEYTAMLEGKGFEQIGTRLFEDEQSYVRITINQATTEEGETMNETTNTTNNMITEEGNTMTTEQAISAIINYFEENDDEFTEVIEGLDSWCGYLGDDRYYEMYMLDEFYTGCEPSEILNRAYYGHDGDTWTTDEHGEKHYGEFCPNREYFYYNGYGNLVSSDYKDYSAHLDKWFVEKLIDEAYNLDSIPDDVQSIIDSIED